MKKIISVLLCLALVFSCGVFYKTESSAQNGELQFNSDGKFKILIFADCQDDASPKSEMISFMNDMLDYTKPDLVVFTGDNVYVSTKSSFDKGAKAIIDPLISRGIPYAYTFGNHDDQLGVSKEYQHSVYMSLGTCLTYDANPSMTGFGTCNLPIKSSDGTDTAFNLWMIDSNTYDGSNYDNVHQDQLDWITSTNAALTASVGHPVNSLAFQHIIVPEAYDLLVENPNGSKTYNGKKYEQTLNEKAKGYLGEFPCPPAVNSGELDTLAQMGGVLGIVTGHDHSNSFIGTVKGVDLIQTAGMSFQSYGDSNVRGCRLITLDESDTTKYESRTFTCVGNDSGLYYDQEVPELQYRSYQMGMSFISELNAAVAATASSAKSELTNRGYQVIDYDLNKGVGGRYIYMGYKTTTNYADAIKSVKFIISGSDALGITIDDYVFASSVDLNKGAGGNYIYALYSKDPRYGGAITAVSAGESSTLNGYTTAKAFGKNSPLADLNSGAGSKTAYFYYKSVDTVVDIVSLEANVNSYSAVDVSPYTVESASNFTASLNYAKSILDDFKDDGAAIYSQDQIIEAQSEIFIKYDALELAHVHSFGDWTVAIKPTTQAEGREERVCACGEKEYRMIEKIKVEELVPTVNDSTLAVEQDNSLIYGFTLFEDFRQPIKDTFTLKEGTHFVFRNTTTPRTGEIVEVRADTTEDLVCRYTIVVFGDVNGDGIYDGRDATLVAMIEGGMLTPDAAYRLAADCNRDGTVDYADTALLEQAGVLLAEIGQEDIRTSSVYDEYVSLISQDVEIEAEPEPEQEQPQMSLIEKIVSFLVNVFKALLGLIIK